MVAAAIVRDDGAMAKDALIGLIIGTAVKEAVNAPSEGAAVSMRGNIAVTRIIIGAPTTGAVKLIVATARNTAVLINSAIITALTAIPTDVMMTAGIIAALIAIPTDVMMATGITAALIAVPTDVMTAAGIIAALTAIPTDVMMATGITAAPIAILTDVMMTAGITAAPITAAAIAAPTGITGQGLTGIRRLMADAITGMDTDRVTATAITADSTTFFTTTQVMIRSAGSM